MDKKASIVTFHCVPNYGAVLQTYAMQEYLKEHFSNVNVVDYRPKSILKEYKYLNFYSIYSLGLSVWSLSAFWKKRRKFRAFEKKHLKLTQPDNLETDLLVLGSDQIWNSQITRGLDPVYYGGLPCKNAPTVISYAASLGKGTLEETEKAFFVKAFEKIDCISVREEEAKRLLAPLTEKQISVTADPTILAGAECFLPLIKPVEQKNYVLLYSLNGYKETADMAQKVSRYLGLPLVELSGRRKGLVKKKHKTLFSAGPEEFVSLIAGADFVVTDSFHGTVFSLLFHKRFVSIPHKKRNGRLSGLLEICGLQDRLSVNFKRKVVDEKPDWEEVEQRLSGLRNKSEQFLKGAGVGNA